jgi:putative Holliday junction resolvase
MRALPRVETLVLPPRARLIGVDLGSKTIGLALSDVERSLASPLMTIKRTQFVADAQALALDGGDSPRAQATRAFAREFTKRHPMPLVFWDERMSTAAVERDLIAHDVSRARRAEVIDKMAAAYILQGALDRLANESRNNLR